MHARDLFEILVRENADMLTAFIRSSVRDPVMVDDLFQETMLVAWKKLDAYDKERPFGPWLRGIAVRLILAYRRKSAKGFALCNAEVLEFLESRHEALGRQRGDTLDEKLECLRDCVQALPSRYRVAIELRYGQEMSSVPLAERLGISTEALKKRLQRGRARLLDCLKRKLTLTMVQA
jgi:RNA polymerase sigma-70 factor (ECF subfamily)